MNTEERVLKLTTALYRVTDQFPENEPFVQALRKQGLKILELVVRKDDKEEIKKNIKIIKYYLRLAKSLRVTNPVNLEVLQREYDNMAQCVAENIIADTTLREQKQYVKGDINKRQKAVVEYLKERKQAKVSDLQNIFKNISSKTIQRDLHDLVARNTLAREGDKRWTTYKLHQAKPTAMH